MRRIASLLAVVSACSSSPPRTHAPPPTPPPPTPPAPVATAEPPAKAVDEACKPPEPPKPPDPADASDGGDNSGGLRDRLAHGKTTCDVADDNLARDEAAILAQPAQPVVAARPYDHKGALAALPIVERRFTLQPDELARLRTAGAVVPARLELTSFAQGYHEIFQSQLPVYITADSIFQAIFASHDDLVSSLETGYGGPTLAGALDAALDAMHCALPAASADYPPEVARDLDLYLTVARSLSSTPVHAKLDGAVDREAAALVAQIVAGDKIARVSVFGRDRLVDFTQYQPRGHYATDANGQPLPDDAAERHYFRTAMWASRFELNLVSRSSRSSAPGPEPDPSETPREALDALALADLAAKSGAAAQIDKLDRAWALLAGKREDVSIAQLAELRTSAHIASLRDPGAFAALKTAIGNNYQRTTRIHPMPEGSRVLPAIATLIGPRIVADAQAIMPIVHSAVPDRHVVGAADIAYLLGFDRAKPYLAADLAKYPTLDAQLAVARKGLAAFTSDDLYGAWLGAIRGLAVDPPGAKPSYLATDVGRDLRLDTIATAYGQLKHNYVLMAGQPYSEFGCEIPDGYVEPVPAAFDGLVEYAHRGVALATILDPDDKRGLGAYYKRVAAVVTVLRTIAQHELAGQALSAAEVRWLGAVAEMSQDRSADVTGYPPLYTGWYFDLFYGREENALRAGRFVADYFTSPEAGVAYLGATAPRLGIFVIDAGGAPRVAVGPVARGYERHEPIGARLTDDVSASTKIGEAWAASYTVASPAARPSMVRVTVEDTARPQEAHPKPGSWTAKIEMTIATDQALGPTTIKLLDHHRVPFATKTVKLAAGETKVAWGKQTKQVGAVYVEVGSFRDVIVADAYDDINQAGWGGAQ